MSSNGITSTVNVPPKVFFVDRATGDLEPNERLTEPDASTWQVLRRCLGAVGAWHACGAHSWVSASYVGRGLALTVGHALPGSEPARWHDIAWGDGTRSKVQGLFAAGDALQDWALLKLEEGGHLPATPLLPIEWSALEVSLLHFSGALDRDDQHNHRRPHLQYSGLNPQRRDGPSHLRHRCDTAPAGSGSPVLAIVEGAPRLMAVHGNGINDVGEWNRAVLVQTICLPNGTLLTEQ